MSKAALSIINTAMVALGINYLFRNGGSNPKYPYFVGEYQETPSMNEDGMQETTFLLTGYARGEDAIAELEEVKEKIKKHFPQVGGRLATVDGSAVAIFYDNAFANLPTGDAELEKIQINLKVKEWSE